MPHKDDAIRYAERATTTIEELRRACSILMLPTGGSTSELRERLRDHLAALDAGRPVICLNPGPITVPAGHPGPRLPRPEAAECAAVFAHELALVPDADDFVAMLRSQADTTRALAVTFGEAQAAVRYAPGKWTVRETIGHLSDCERILSYRLLRALRGDTSTLPGFDEVAYVGAGLFETRALAQVVEEFVAVREATATLIASAPPARFAHRIAVGSGSMTGLALAYLIAGHERHHQHLLRTRYLPCLPGA